MRKRPRDDAIFGALKAGVSSLTISSYVSTKDLVCRDDHAKKIVEFLEEPVHHTLQIFGMPGTGKTATVNYALSVLSRNTIKKKPSAVFLNGYVIQKSSDIYWTLYQHLMQTRWHGSPSCSAEQCATVLEKKLRQAKSGVSSLCVIIVDEADKMLEKHSKALFKIIDWLSLPQANFKLITISNSMDLNMDAKTKSRLDMTKVLTFEPYRINELKEILLRRISSIEPKLFADQAINLLCQQVASQYGDVRRLLQTASAAVCSVLMKLSEHSLPSRNFAVDGIVSLQELHGIIRQSFHDRFIEFLRSLVSPTLFCISCLVASETEALYQKGERDFRIPLDRLFVKVQQVQQKMRISTISRIAFVEKLDLLRQVSMIDISIGSDRVPLVGADAVMEAADDVFIALLQPFQTIIDSCKLHEIWGERIGRIIFN